MDKSSCIGSDNQLIVTTLLVHYQAAFYDAANRTMMHLRS